MKTWKLGITAALCLTILSACDSEDTMTGSLSTGTTAFTFMDKDGKQQSLPADKTYSAKIQLTDKGAELDVSTGAFSSLAMLLPNPTTSLSGKFKVSAADSKQAFDSLGDVEISSTQRDNSHSESCVLTYHSEYECVTSKMKKPNISASAPGSSPNDPIPGGPGGGSNPGSSPNDPIPGGPGNGNDNNNNNSAPVTTCSWVQEPVYGSQWVDETIELSSKNVSIDFNDSATQAKRASFNGSRDLGSSVSSSSASACR